MSDPMFHKAASAADSTESRLDGVLKEFFHHEIPPGLGSGTLNWSDVDSGAGRHPQLVTTTSAPAPVSAPRRHSLQRRLSVMIGLTVVVAALVLIVQPGRKPPNTPSTIVDRNSGSPQPSQPEELMMVSPRGDQPAGTGVIGDHGLTIQETEEVDLSPPNRPTSESTPAGGPDQ